MGKKGKMTRWNVIGKGSYTPGTHSVDALPSGLYNAGFNMEGNLYIDHIEVRSDRLCQLSTGPRIEVLETAAKFWESRKLYEDIGVAHKRGLLLWGPPGNGKSRILEELVSCVVDHGGLAFDMSTTMGDSRRLLRVLSDIEGRGKRPLLLFVEDLDNYSQGRGEQAVMSLLDGVSDTLVSTLFVGTTNYLDRIPERIKWRPSRIDTLIKVGNPDASQRLEYLKFVVAGMPAAASQRLTTKDLDAIAASSNGLCLAAIKEVLISSLVFGISPEEAVSRLRKVKAL